MELKEALTGNLGLLNAQELLKTKNGLTNSNYSFLRRILRMQSLLQN